MITLETLADYAGLDPEDMDERRFGQLLREAKVLIRSEVDLPGDMADWPEEAQIVALRVMARAYEVDDTPAGVSQLSYTAGPFSRNVSYRADASAGGLWLSKADKRLLGVSGGTAAYAVDLMPTHRERFQRPDWWVPYA